MGTRDPGCCGLRRQRALTHHHYAEHDCSNADDEEQIVGALPTGPMPVVRLVLQHLSTEIGDSVDDREIRGHGALLHGEPSAESGTG